MNTFFFLLIFIVFVIILAAISFLFRPIGKFFAYLWNDIKDILSK